MLAPDLIGSRSQRMLEVALRLDKTLIADLPLFEGFEPSALEDILERAHAVHYPKGKVVFSQNEQAPRFAATATPEPDDEPRGTRSVS